MTDNSFDNLRTLHAATTPGEWGFETSGLPLVDDEPRYVIVAGSADVASDVLGSHDAAFIVAAKNELPALLARLDEVTAERDALAAVIAEAQELARPAQSVPLGMSEWKHADSLLAATHRALDTAPSSVLAAHDAKVRAEAWDECLDEIEEHELNTEQAREGSPYRTKEENR